MSRGYGARQRQILEAVDALHVVSLLGLAGGDRTVYRALHRAALQLVKAGDLEIRYGSPYYENHPRRRVGWLFVCRPDTKPLHAWGAALPGYWYDGGPSPSMTEIYEASRRLSVDAGEK